MDVARLAGFVVLGAALGTWGFLGAPLSLLILIGAFPLITLLLPGGAGAAAASNLARKLYDRPAWEKGWDRGYLSEDEDGRPARRRDRRRPREDVPPDLFPDDPEESRAWLRTLREIRELREDDAPRGAGDRGEAGGPAIP